MIEILDTTLREGEQTPYVNFTIDEKIGAIVDVERRARQTFSKAIATIV